MAQGGIPASRFGFRRSFSCFWCVLLSFAAEIFMLRQMVATYFFIAPSFPPESVLFHKEQNDRFFVLSYTKGIMVLAENIIREWVSSLTGSLNYPSWYGKTTATQTI